MRKPVSGVLKFIFSRALLFLLLILVELALLYSILTWFRSNLMLFTAIQLLLMIGVFFYLWNCTMDATSKMTWLLVLAIVPVPGSILLLYTRTDIGQRFVRRRLLQFTALCRRKLVQEPSLLKAPQILESGTESLHHYLNRSGAYPLYRNTQTQYFSSGEATFDAMLEELRKAEEFIFLEFFIIAEGQMWGQILPILAEKAAAGVDVRVMYDGICEITTLSFDYSRRLQRLGIKSKPFSRLRPLVTTTYNNRDHRKLLVIDNKVAFTGGINLADEYINRIDRFGHWKDAAVMVKGDGATSFTAMFLQLWNITEREPVWDPYLQKQAAPAGDGFVMPYGDSPVDPYRAGENVYIDILSRARSYVYIMTPYLVLDNKLENALLFAAQRGVDIRILLPGVPDKKLTYALAKSHYRQLLFSGVQVYEYTPGFLHGKVFVSDDEKAVVGTINLDYRSLYHHYECGAYLYGCSCIADIKKDFENTLKQCRRVTPETIRNERLFYKVAGAIVKPFAPLL
ncbi:MAG: cardiolipin synthase [Firmicutes bacterium]|nr:cardiolipin synthase [Bacillota bacterium]